MKKLFAFAALVVVIGVGGWMLFRRYSEAKVIQQHLARLEAELSYTKQLTAGLRSAGSPPPGGAMTVILSAKMLNSVLSGLVGASVSLPQAKAQLKVNSVSLDLRDGFPEVHLDSHSDTSKPKLGIDSVLIATLEPQVSSGSPSTMQLLIRPLEIHPTVAIGATEVKGTRELDSLLAAILAEYAATLPRMTIPLASTFQIDFPQTTQQVRVPTHDGALNGSIEFPHFAAASTIALKEVYFLSDGIHLIASLDQNTPELLPFKREGHTSRPLIGDAGQLIKDKEAELLTARAELAPLAKDLKLNDSDLFVSVSPSLLNTVLGSFNALTDAQRTVHFRTASEEGQLYRTGGGGLGCGGYAELVGHNSASADVKMGALASAFSPNAIALSGDLAFSFSAQVTGHVNGPAGPHATFDLKCIKIFGKDVCTNVPGVAISCDSPVGGGVGLSNFGISGNRTERVTAQVSVTSDAASWLHYIVQVTSPSQVPITIEVGLGQLGTLGLPFTFSIPNLTIASGAAPPLFSSHGRLEANMPLSLNRQYDVSVIPVSAILDQTGYRVKARTELLWLESK